MFMVLGSSAAYLKKHIQPDGVMQGQINYLTSVSESSAGAKDHNF